MNEYTIGAITFIKIADNVEQLGSHCSVPIPESFPFSGEHGTFQVKGPSGIFFISDRSIRLGVRYGSDEQDDSAVYDVLRQVYFDSLKDEVQKLRESEGYGPVYTIAGIHVRKVSDSIPYVGYLCVHDIEDELLNDHEWLDAGIGNGWTWDFPLLGTYRLVGTDRIFFLKRNEIEVHGEEGETHPLMQALLEKYPLDPRMHDEEDIGPFGGAFSSDTDYWKYRDSSLFASIY